MWDFSATYGHGWLAQADLYDYPAACPVPGCAPPYSANSPPPSPPLPPSPPSPPPPPPSTVISGQLAALRNGTLQMNGVNLGGWLVLESFLSPEMFANASTTTPFKPNDALGVTGEYQLGIDAAQQDAADKTHSLNVTGQLRAAFALHRNTFIQESDFQLMASVGINAVRIPVGYWLFAQTQVRKLPPQRGERSTQTVLSPLSDAMALPHWALTQRIGGQSPH